MKIQHLDGPQCPTCYKILKDAHPELREWFNQRVKPVHPDAHISCGYRGQDEQAQIVKEGKEKMPYPLSAHNKMDSDGNPCAKALDLFFIDRDGVDRFPFLRYQLIATEIRADKLPLFWGYDKWRMDADHFQLV